MQVVQVTPPNAALVEGAAAAAGSLEDQARNLREAVAVFQLPGGQALNPMHDGDDLAPAANTPRGAVLAFSRERHIA